MIKKLALIFLPLFIVFAFVACEKEYSSENETGSSYGTATYTFAGSPSTCTTVKLNGDYVAGVKLDTSNTVEVTVNVTKTGTYIISTATFNDISFFGTGTFTTTGNHTVILYGDGIPVVAKTYTYPVGLNGCSFNIAFEKPATDTGGGTAVFSYPGSPGNCISATVEGVYKTGTPFDITNVVKIKVNVTTPGTYNIVTNTINGFAFSASGTFTTAGEQTVDLKASGLPAAVGNNTFIPTGNGCSFVVNVTDGAPSGDAAIFSLNGAPAACTGAIANGAYIVGTPLNASNTVLITANVTKAGTYAIVTTMINGFSFSASGTFTGTGLQPVTLTGIGTPVTIGPFNFTAGATGCTFTINCNSAVTTVDFLKCKIDGVLTHFNKNLIGYNITPPNAGIPYSVSVQGKNSDVAGSIEELWVTVQNPTAVTIGDYDNGTFASGITDRLSQTGFYPTGFPNLYWGSSALTSNTFKVIISSITSTGATGTFSGTLYDNNGGGIQTKQITEGEFKISF